MLLQRNVCTEKEVGSFASTAGRLTTTKIPAVEEALLHEIEQPPEISTRTIAAINQFRQP